MSASHPTVAVPVLPVADLVRAVAWYERLGFEARAEFPSYAILAFDGAEVHLREADGLPLESASGGYLRVADADAVFARWTAMGAPTVAPPQDQPYGIREFATEDLDANLWRVGSALEAVPVDDPAPEPVAEVPSAKHPTDAETDWFEVVSSEDPCSECGLLSGELHVRALGAQVRDDVHAFGDLLRAADDHALRRHPAPGAWSALEYGVHTRDLLAVFAERIIRTMAEHEPELGWWDHEEAIADGMANESDVDAVADDMGRNASKVSEALRMVGDDDWVRAATRRGSERFTIELMARFTLHEVVHHHHDARLALRP